MREIPLVIVVVSALTLALSLATFYDDEIALLLLDRDSCVWPLIEMTTPIATGYVITLAGHVLLYNALGMPIECTKRLLLVIGSVIVCFYGIWSSMAQCARYALDIIYNAQHRVGWGHVVVVEQKQHADMLGLALIVFTLFCFSTVMVQIWLSGKKRPIELVLLQRGALMCLAVIGVSTVAAQQTTRSGEWYESGPNCPVALVHASNLFLLQLLSLKRTSEIKVIQWWLASVFNVLVAMSQMCLGKAYCSDVVLTCLGSLLIVYCAIRFNRYTIVRVEKTILPKQIETKPETKCKRKEVALQIANAIGDLMVDHDDTKLIDLMIVSQRMLKEEVVEQV